MARRARPAARAAARARCARVRDLERLLAKAARPGATPRDLAALRASLGGAAGRRRLLSTRRDDACAARAPRRRDPRPAACPRRCPRRAALLEAALVDDPPAVPRGSRGASEIGYVRAGFHAELDALREAAREGRDWIAGLEARERERSGIPSAQDPLPPGPRLRHRGQQVEARARARRLRAQADARQRRALHDARAARDGGTRSSAPTSARRRSSASSSSALRHAVLRARGRDPRGGRGGRRSRRARSRSPRWRAATAGRVPRSTRASGSRSAPAAIRWSRRCSRAQGGEEFVAERHAARSRRTRRSCCSPARTCRARAPTCARSR